MAVDFALSPQNWADYERCGIPDEVGLWRARSGGEDSSHGGDGLQGEKAPCDCSCNLALPWPGRIRITLDANQSKTKHLT